MPIAQVPSPLTTILATGTYDSNWFPGATIEAQIQAAINAAAADGAPRVLVHSAYDASLITFNSNVRMVREGGDWSVFDVKAYGAAGDNVTDDTIAIRAALAAAAANNGGVVWVPKATYVLSTIGTTTVRIPVSNGATFQPGDEVHPYHFLLQNVDNIRVLSDGATFRSTYAFGGEMLIADGMHGFEWNGIGLESVNSKDGTGAVIVAGMGGLGFTSMTRAAYDIKISSVKLVNVYTGLYFFGDPANPRIDGIVIDRVRHEGGIYTLATHDNGDNLVATAMFSSNTLRDYFAYGVSNHRVEMTSEIGVGGFGSLIKAYDRDIKNINYRLLTSKNLGAPNVSIQSQHAPAIQATPARCLNITVDVDNSAALTGTGVAVSFDYYRDATLTATSANNLFNGITLAGVHREAPTTTVTQNTTTARGRLNTDKLVLLAGALQNMYSRTGFYDDKQIRQTFAPVLKINGSAAGITYTTQVGEWWRDGQFIEMVVRLTLSNKGGSVGAVTIDLPVQSSDLFNTKNCLVLCIGNANMAGLTGPIIGFIQSSGTLLALQQQGAAAAANLTDANLTNTSDILLQARYQL